ncbi:unnamed protein product [Cunninghamella blakesleeana]
MKFLTLFIITLWMISMFVLAAETEDTNQNVDQNQNTEQVEDTNNNEEMMDSEENGYDQDGHGGWRRCFWTHCSHRPRCPHGSWVRDRRRCGRWGYSYCCSRRHGGWDDDDHDD